MSEWNVYYNNAFYFNDNPTAASVIEITVNKEFLWSGETWKILSIFLFDEGPVVQLCKQVAPQAIDAFQSKWRSLRTRLHSGELVEIPQEELDMMMADSPFGMDASLKVKINGRLLEQANCPCEGWNPIRDFDDDADYSDILRFLNHYSLDEQSGWYLVHACSRWSENAIQDIEAIQIIFEAEPVTMPGPHFSVREEGDEIEFTRPLTGQKHTLKALYYQPAVLDYSNFEDSIEDQWECPKHHFQLAYTVTPELPDEVFFVTDCDRGDSPRPKPGNKDIAFEILHTGSIIPLSACEQSEESYLFSTGSSLHFDPVDNVQWRMVFHEKIKEDLTLTLQAGRDFGIMVP